MASASHVVGGWEGHLLEQPALLIGPATEIGARPLGWQAKAWTAQPGEKIRSLSEAATGKAVGFARWTHSRMRWFSWLRGASSQLEVFETEDASLVMTLFPPGWWRRAWVVQDAENRLVGKVAGPHLLDAWGQRFARRAPQAPASGRRFVGWRGEDWGEFTVLPDGTIRLHFHPILEGQPFSRMMLLAAVLSLP